jgi:transposase InsO family protein
MAESLSTDDFIPVFRRLIALCTKPISVHSDNGINFVGAENELNSLLQEMPKDPSFQRFNKEKNIDWKFQPPRAPHFGGAHESLVRSTKKALYRVLGIEKEGLRYPSDEILRNPAGQDRWNAERPTLNASTDPSDFRPLTPNDFLNRPPAYNLPPGSFSYALPDERFWYVQRSAQLFWDLLDENLPFVPRSAQEVEGRATQFSRR